MLNQYKVSHHIAKCKKPHTIGEELILPAALDMATILLGEKSATTLTAVPLSNDMVRRRIFDMSDDLQEQLVEHLTDKRSALQMDEATDSNRDCLFIANVRFETSGSLCEELLFCKCVQKRATADELFKLMDGYVNKHGPKWENCVNVCTDGAQTMGLQGLIRKASPNAKWTHCVIHRQAVASRQHSP